MRKVLHISQYYYPFAGGREQTARDCVNALKTEYEQRVICFNHDGGDSVEVIDDVKVIRCGCFARVSSQDLSFSYGKKLKFEIKAFKPDVVIFHYPNPFAAFWLLKYLSGNTKLVVYWHLDIVKQKILRFFFHRQNNALVERANLIIATTLNYIEGSRYLLQAKDKCRVIYSCVNVGRLQLNKEDVRLAEEIRDKNVGKNICLAVGRHTKYKGFKYLIEASKYLDDCFRIYIIGEGKLTKKLKEQAAGDEKIIFLGLVSDDVLKAYMYAADIFCFSSITKNEAFGLALAEAMYYGKASVTFTIAGSGVNFVSLNGVTGIEVPNCDVEAYANAIKKLTDDDELREKYGRQAKKRVEDNFLDSDFAKQIKATIDYI